MNGMLGKNKELKEFLTVEEVAKMLRISNPTVVKLIKTGTIPGFKCGKVWRIKRDSLTSALDAEIEKR